MQVSMKERLMLMVDVTDDNRNERLVKEGINQFVMLHNRDSGDTHITADQVTEVEVEVPSHLAICGKCNGKGSHSLRFGAFSGERLAEAREDQEFWESYTSGQLDDSCDRCEGTGRVKVPNDNLPAWLASAIEADDAAEEDSRAERHAEMRAQYGTEWGPEWGDE